MKSLLSLLSVFLVSAFISEGLSASLPNTINPCKLSDAPQSLNKCIKEAAQKFLAIIKKPNPDIGLPSFEPLKVPDILSTDPILNFKFTNNKIVGFTTNTKFEDFKLEQNKKRFRVTFVNTGQLESDYTVDGRLLLLPVTGKGKSVIKMFGVRYVYKFKYDIVTGKDGLTYWKIVKHNVNYTPENMTYSFANLFNGNKVLSNGIKPCKLSDAPQSLNKCIKEAAQKFLPILKKPNPDIGFPSFEPLKVPDILSTDPILNFKFTNNKILGYTTDTKIEDFKLEQNKKRFTITLVNAGQMESDYTLDGRLLLLPVNGKGKSVIWMSGVRYVYKFKYDIVKEQNGPTYWKIVKHNVNFTPQNMTYSFTNLFNGNKVLSDAIHQLANENWRDIYSSLSKPALFLITDVIAGAISNFFTKVPVDQLFTA